MDDRPRICPTCAYNKRTSDKMHISMDWRKQTGAFYCDNLMSDNYTKKTGYCGSCELWSPK